MKKTMAASLLLTLVFYACKKEVSYEKGPILRALQSTLTLRNYAGAATSFDIESNLGWRIVIEGEASHFLQLDTSAGRGNATIAVLLTQMTDGDSTFVVKLSCPSNPSITPITVLIQIRSYQFTMAWSNRLGGTGLDEPAHLAWLTGDKWLVGGHTTSNDGDVTNFFGNSDGWVATIAGTGGLLSERTMGGTSFDDILAVAPTADGGYIAIGYVYSKDGLVHGYHANSDAWIARFNSNRDTVWTQTWGGSKNDYGTAITPTTDGHFLITGFTNSNDGDFSGSFGTNDGWILKIDADGKSMWQQFLRVGGSGSEEIRGIAMTPDGGGVAAGFSRSTDIAGTVNTGGSDAYVIRFDANGQVIWQKLTGGPDIEEARAISSYADGSIVLAGYTASAEMPGYHGNGDGWVVKFNKDGNLLWSRNAGGSDIDRLHTVAATAGGGFIVGGYTNSSDHDITGSRGKSDGWLMQFDGKGNRLWQHLVGGTGNDIIKAIALSADGTLMMTAATDSRDGDLNGPGNGGTDIWVAGITIQ